MTTLGIALIACGLTLVCANVVFLWIVGREPSSSQESFKESLERFDSHMRQTPRDSDDKSEAGMRPNHGGNIEEPFRGSSVRR
jgi:hypothetical protein